MTVFPSLWPSCFAQSIAKLLLRKTPKKTNHRAPAHHRDYLTRRSLDHLIRRRAMLTVRAFHQVGPSMFAGGHLIADTG